MFLERHHAEQSTEGLFPVRMARVQVVIPIKGDGNHLFELVVDLDNGSVAKKEHLKGKHSYIDSAYMKDVETACMADERIQAEIKKLELPEGANVCVEPWAYATDGMNDMSQRTTMVGFISNSHLFHLALNITKYLD